MDAQLGLIEKKPSYRPKYKRRGLGRTRSELRNDMLDAACALLRKGSYETLSMEDVAALAATSRRTLYNLFQDKDELYREACNRMIRTVSDLTIDEIPEQMSVSDGLRYYVASCVEIYSGRMGMDLVMVVARDSPSQPWLSQLYQRDIFGRLVRACENFLLKKARRIPLAPSVPRFVGEQIATAIKSMSIAPWTGGQSALPAKDLNARTELLVKAYSSIIDTSNIKI